MARSDGAEREVIERLLKGQPFKEIVTGTGLSREWVAQTINRLKERRLIRSPEPVGFELKELSAATSKVAWLDTQEGRYAVASVMLPRTDAPRVARSDMVVSEAVLRVITPYGELLMVASVKQRFSYRRLVEQVMRAALLSEIEVLPLDRLELLTHMAGSVLDVESVFPYEVAEVGDGGEEGGAGAGGEGPDGGAGARPAAGAVGR